MGSEAWRIESLESKSRKGSVSLLVRFAIGQKPKASLEALDRKQEKKK